MDRFTLTIELGNDAMQTKYDVAEALREIADRLDQQLTEWGYAERMTLRDDNGNTVGLFGFEARVSA